jgi:CRP/FNR family transcriptional regulator
VIALTNQILLAFPFLTALRRDSRQLLAEQSVLLTRERGEVLLRHGARVTGMYLVVAGSLRVYALRSDGGQALLYRVAAGQSCLLATNALFSNSLYPAWVDVESNQAKVLTLPETAIRPLFDTEPVLRKFVLQILADRLFDLMTTIEELSLLSIEDRLKSYLLRRADAAGVVKVTHEEIAGDLATAREVISRQIARWRRAGLIGCSRGTIRLLKLREVRSAL